VWPTLLYTYLAARLRPHAAGPDDPSHWCFNYVVDERVARKEFAAPHDFLFAREALTARPVVGGAFYRGMVGEATWLADEVPRLYERWKADGLPPLPPEAPAPPLIRVLNTLLFPIVASYLSLVALFRNHQYRRRGEATRCFRVRASLGRLTYETERFESLRELYEPATFRTPEGRS